MELSIVTTMYKSSDYLVEFYTRSVNSAEKITSNFEIIFVNDGSPDDSLEVILNLQKKDSRIVLIDFSRNFGHHKAMMVGLDYARGDKVFLIDCDLEEKPEVLNLFFQKMQHENCDVVYGVQLSRQGAFHQKFFGNLYYWFGNLMSEVKVPRNQMTVRLMKMAYVKSLLLYKEREVNIGSLWYSTGYNQKPFFLEKKLKKGTTYDLNKKLTAIFNQLTAFSSKPLLIIFYVGLFISIFSIFYIAYLLVEKILFHLPVSGWTSLIVSIWFLGGITIFFMGIIAIYLSKIFIEVKQRPQAIVRAVFRGGVESNNE